MVTAERASERRVQKQTKPLAIARVAGVSALWLVAGVGAVLMGAAVWIRRTFGDISVNQLLLHLPGAGGAEVTGAETGYLFSFICEALFAPLAILAGTAIVWVLLRRVLSKQKTILPRTSLNAKLKPLLHGMVAVAIILVGAGVFANTINIWGYYRSQVSNYEMFEYYVAPDANGSISSIGVTGATSAPKNLVFIFLESIEDQMGNEEYFDGAMLAPVLDATEGWQTVSDYQPYAGGGWTMAGIVGTSCGVPLRGAGIGENDISSNEIGADAETFMPGAVCLGDVLSSEGYQNVFLGGADAQFASKSTFLRSHGYDEVKDLSTWVERGETELSGWGLSDRRLLENAKDEVVRLHESGQPFNLTMLTLDSHEPTHLFDYCEQTTTDPLESAIRCSMEQVAGFLEFMDQQGYLDDTVVVLSGDHPKMLGEAFVSLGALKNADNRPLFNRIWSPDGVTTLRAGADQLSMFATILDLLRMGREDHRAGIGVSAYVDSAPGSVLDLTGAEYQELIESRSKELYQDLWKVPTLNSV